MYHHVPYTKYFFFFQSMPVPAFIQQSGGHQVLVAAARDIAYFIAELSIALLWLDLLQRVAEKRDYEQALNYWLRYTMREDSLHAASALGLDQ